jgi:cytochrome c55X
MGQSIIKVVCFLKAMLLLSLMASSQVYANKNSLTSERQSELSHIVKQDCGSCHGLTLKGGLGRALLVENLQNKPTLFIQHTILYGRPGTAMPPWKTLLTDQEALWIAEQLKQGNISNKHKNKD